MSAAALRTAALLAATITTGLAAGTFALYAHTIMPGLETTDDRTFVGAYQAVDRAIVNPWFMASAFLGATAFTLAAAVSSLGRPTLPWIAAALALYGVAVVVTLAINVPLNDGIKAAGDPARIADLAAVRERFHESRWVAWNLVRTATTLAAFACLAWALVLEGRSSG
jgi:uncharacterized membrane protein